MMNAIKNIGLILNLTVALELLTTRFSDFGRSVPAPAYIEAAAYHLTAMLLADGILVGILSAIPRLTVFWIMFFIATNCMKIKLLWVFRVDLYRFLNLLARGEEIAAMDTGSCKETGAGAGE